mmetsp:Transcript_174484/g.553880  ORF Transcript_174484/g.553880 Transcript_174484/m.553880 type:complete len:222 (+) Transcript_174484:524-1189(+)
MHRHDWPQRGPPSRVRPQGDHVRRLAEGVLGAPRPHHEEPAGRRPGHPVQVWHLLLHRSPEAACRGHPRQVSVRARGDEGRGRSEDLHGDCPGTHVLLCRGLPSAVRCQAGLSQVLWPQPDGCYASRVGCLEVAHLAPQEFHSTSQGCIKPTPAARSTQALFQDDFRPANAHFSPHRLLSAGPVREFTLLATGSEATLQHSTAQYPEKIRNGMCLKLWSQT